MLETEKEHRYSKTKILFSETLLTGSLPLRSYSVTDESTMIKRSYIYHEETDRQIQNLGHSVRQLSLICFIIKKTWGKYYYYWVRKKNNKAK